VGYTVTVNGHIIIVPPLLPGWKTQLVSWAVAFLMLTIGWLLFTRMESKFAYHI
jgi:ABC-type polysaccharide/polyol phosphate export permease